MSDIVRRLRVETDRICSEAADEIERLRAIEWRKQAQHWESEARSCRALLFEKEAKIERLRAALQEVVRLRLSTDEGTCARRFDSAWEVACKALEGK